VKNNISIFLFTFPICLGRCLTHSREIKKKKGDEKLNELLKFGYENGETLECVELDGEPLFNPITVGNCLGIAEKTVKNTISMMDPEDYLDLGKNPEKESVPNFGMQTSQRYWLRESGMYLFVFKSRKPEAKNFKKWLARDVIPQIRQTGRYESELQNQNVLTRRLLDNMTRNLEQLTGVMAEELAITQNESWNKRLSNLMIDCSTRGLGTVKELYNELFHVFAGETDIDIPEIAELKGINRMDYLRKNKELCRTLYAFAHNHFSSHDRQVVLVPLDKDQKRLDRFVGGK
jgi:prophage antirepressor-like protein